MASLQLKTSEILSAIGLVCGNARDPSTWDATSKQDARLIIRSGLRRFLHPETADGSIHQWRFTERKFYASYDVPYETGTVAIAAGVVTLLGGTFPTWADDGVLRVASHTLVVTARTDATHLVVSNTGLVVTAGADFCLYRYRFGLDAEFAEFIGGVTYEHPTYALYIRNVSDAEIRLRYTANFKIGQPIMYSIVKGDNTDASKWYMEVWPTMDEGGSITGVCRIEPFDGLDDTDVNTNASTTVQVEAVYGEALLAAILCAAEEFYNDARMVHSGRYPSVLAAAIKHDRHVQGGQDFTRKNPTTSRDILFLTHVPDYDTI